MTIEVSNILIQLSMFTEYSNIVWQLKTEIILMHNWQCLLNTPILYDNWRQKLYSYNCQCLLNIPILYDNWSQQYTHTIVNVYWILQYCMAIEDRNYTHAQLAMFTKYSNIVWQLKTETILMHNWQCLLNTPILYDNCRQKLYLYNCQCWLNTPILYDNWSQQYTHTIVNVYWILQYCMTIEDRNYTHSIVNVY